MLTPSTDPLVATPRVAESSAVTAMSPTNGATHRNDVTAEMTGRASSSLSWRSTPHEALNSANDLEKTPMVDILPDHLPISARSVPHRRGDHRACAGQSRGEGAQRWR